MMYASCSSCVCLLETIKSLKDVHLANQFISMKDQLIIVDLVLKNRQCNCV
jgi:hypothetical protein